MYNLIDIMENANKYIRILRHADIDIKRVGIYFEIKHQNTNEIIDYPILKDLADRIT